MPPQPLAWESIQCTPIRGTNSLCDHRWILKDALEQGVNVERGRRVVKVNQQCPRYSGAGGATALRDAETLAETIPSSDEAGGKGKLRAT